MMMLNFAAPRPVAATAQPPRPELGWGRVLYKYGPSADDAGSAQEGHKEMELVESAWGRAHAPARRVVFLLRAAGSCRAGLTAAVPRKSPHPHPRTPNVCNFLIPCKRPPQFAPSYAVARPWPVITQYKFCRIRVSLRLLQ